MESRESNQHFRFFKKGMKLHYMSPMSESLGWSKCSMLEFMHLLSPPNIKPNAKSLRHLAHIEHVLGAGRENARNKQHRSESCNKEIRCLLSLVSLLAFIWVSSKCSWLKKAVVTCRQQQLPVLNWPIWSSHDYVTCSFRKHTCGTNAFRGPNNSTTSEFHVVLQPFPSLPAIPMFLGSIPGTKEQGLEVDLESEKVHCFSMALHAYWLPRIAYYCRLIALIASYCAYCYCCCHLSLLLLLPLVLFLLMNKNKWCFWTPSERPPRTLVILYGCRHFVQLLPFNFHESMEVNVDQNMRVDTGDWWQTDVNLPGHSAWHALQPSDPHSGLA